MIDLKIAIYQNPFTRHAQESSRWNFTASIGTSTDISTNISTSTSITIIVSYQTTKIPLSVTNNLLTIGQ